MKALLGGKGANLAEMTGIGLPVPPGFTITTEVCNHYSANGSYPDGPEGPGGGRSGAPRGRHRQEVRRPQGPAARVGALRRPRLHAGHDGHHPQPGSQRRHVAGGDRPDRQPALRLRLLPPLRLHVRRRRARLQARARGRARPLRGDPREAEAGEGRHLRHRAHCRRPRRARGQVQGRRPGAHRSQLPRGPARAALGRHRRPCSAPGTTTAPSPTGSSTTSPTTGARP